jgi:serine/threonine protein kinase
MGSPGYLAPEQLRGEKLSVQTDIYTLGIMIYEMLIGRRPFMGDSAPIVGPSLERIMYEHLHSQPSSPSQYDPSIPPELGRAVLKCLEKVPESRYTNAMDVFTAIETAVNRNSNLTRESLLHQRGFETSHPSKRGLRVFLCHSSSDKPAVENFYNMLVDDGVDAWLDKKNLMPGQDWQFEIQKAVRDSDVVIVFLSSSSVTKEGFVQKEIRIALDTADEKPDGTIFVIPAKLENCKVPNRLAKFQWVDLFEKDGYERLFKALQMRASSLNIVINRNTNMLPE